LGLPESNGYPVNYFVSNCPILHNICPPTRFVPNLEQHGESVLEDTITAIRPGPREHVGRF
jgi:hypothetical protein